MPGYFGDERYDDDDDDGKRERVRAAVEHAVRGRLWMFCVGYFHWNDSLLTVMMMPTTTRAVRLDERYER